MRRTTRPLRSMPRQSDDTSRARAEALFKRREAQKADAPVAMAEYRAAQRAALERMHELRRLRLARDAQLAARKEAQSPPYRRTGR
jgi:hypothetical protein